MQVRSHHLKTRFLLQEGSLTAHVIALLHGTTCHYLLFSQVFVGPLSALPRIIAPLGTLYLVLNREMYSEIACVDVMNETALAAHL